MSTAANDTRRQRAARLRSESNELAQEIARTEVLPVCIESGLLELIGFGTIQIIVTNGRAQKFEILPSLRVNLELG